MKRRELTLRCFIKSLTNLFTSRQLLYDKLLVQQIHVNGLTLRITTAVLKS